MDCVSETRRRLSIVVRVSVVLALALGLTGIAVAAPVTFNLNYTTSGGATAVGTFAVDSSLLGPNVFIGSDDGLDDLLCFNLVVTLPTGLPLTFTKADLDGWTLSLDSNADFLDVNFFMEACGSYSYIIDGRAPFALGVFQCPDDDNTIAAFDAHPAQGGVCEGFGGSIPTLSHGGLVALLLLVGVAAVLALLRRGATLG